MTWADGRLADTPVRVYRISFSGELSYEIAVPANRGRAFWGKGVPPPGYQPAWVILDGKDPSKM